MSDITQAVKNAFNAKTEVEYYSSLIKKGLLETEKYVINKYFQKIGKILDLGCGAGREAFALAKQGHEVIGIDIAPKMIKYANNYATLNIIPNVSFLVKDINTFTLQKNLFDYIILPTQTIEHIKGRKNRINLLMKCKKSLKKNGIIFITTHERKDGIKFWIYWTKKEIVAKFKKTNDESGDTWIESNNKMTKMSQKMFLHFYTKREALADIKNADLKLIELVKSSDYQEKDWVGKSLKYTFVCK
jgi:2-polyprenyl-3-methyl-5-hydroxy-6-metoxy-1,4-benzoquinol methylase